MKITFIKDCPPIPEAGNSAYKAGDEADLRRAQELMNLGYARKGWGKPPAPKVDDLVIAFDPSAGLEALTDDELRDMAKEAGVKSYWNMKRETLIDRLIDVNK